MATLLHVSDIHFGKPYDPTVGEAFLVAASAARADAIVVSGDFTQRAKVTEYEAARRWLDRLPDLPLIVTPGNHDVPLYRVFERIFYPYRNYRKWIADELDSATRVPGVTVVALNSTAPLRAIVNGRVDDGQLEFAARAFRESDAGDARVVVVHHPLAPAPDYEGDAAMPRAQEILNALDGMGVELVLGGHLHRGYVGNSLDVYPGREGDHGIVIVQSGTTTSRRGRARERARNSFNLVRIEQDHLEISHLMYFADLGRFAAVSVRAFPRRGGRYFSRNPIQDPAPARQGGEPARGDILDEHAGGAPREAAG